MARNMKGYIPCILSVRKMSFEVGMESSVLPKYSSFRVNEVVLYVHGPSKNQSPARAIIKWPFVSFMQFLYRTETKLELFAYEQ